jgi:hypothetical protein
MSDQYTEHDTERARQAQRHSAGLETQQLSLPPAAGYGQATAAPTPGRDPRSLIGLGLVGFGLLWLASRIGLGALDLDIEAGMILLTIGSVFAFFGLWRRIYGLIIPASILAGLSAGVTFADVTDGVSVLWGLALGFLAIYVLGRGLFQVGSPWPMIPAVILFGVGTIVAVANLGSFLGAALIWIPLLLIGAGLYLGFLRKP